MEDCPTPPRIEDFLEQPPRDPAAWRWLWEGDHPFPIRSHRGGLSGRLLVVFKRLFRPLFRTVLADLYDRQRTYNLILLEGLEALKALKRVERLEALSDQQDRRLGHLENFVPKALDDVLAYNDALFSRVDQKLDRSRRETRDLLARLGGALAVAEGSPPAGREELSRVREEQAYLALEARYRGTEAEIRERLAIYLPYLAPLPAGEILDLGCGRGEALTVFGAAGLAARGVDASAEMVAACRGRGLTAEVGDLFERLAAEPAGSLGAVVSFHVVEHLPAPALDRLLRLAWRALVPGGRLILETPNALSLVVAARNFWLDPTHLRPIHPDSLALFAREAGFDPVERLDLRPFAAADRLPEIDLANIPEEQRPLADLVNRLRDRLDDLLFGCQDYALVASKPPSA
jgi:SAM-dependent methyltransferase